MDHEILFALFILAAVCGVTAYVPHQYHFVNEKKNWDEAQRYCRQIYTDLATVNNEDEMSKLNDILIDKPNNDVWIGLKREDVGEWQWCLADRQIKPTNITWCPGEPNNAGGQEYCVMMKKSDHGCLLDENCDCTHPFVCYNETKPPQERYILITEQKSWCDAQRYCREHHTDLASVRNDSENEQIRNVIENSRNDHVWIGLFNNSWKWSDQSDSCYTNWKDNMPTCQHANMPTTPNINNKCVTMGMNQNNLWMPDDCNNNHTFVCHENKLIFINQTLTWTDALRYCRENHSDLVSVHTEEIQYWVMEVVKDASTEHVWMGLGYTCTLGFWYWVNGEYFCYQNWAPGNGTGEEDCKHGDRFGAVQSGGEKQWVSLTVHQKLNFICTRYEG